MVTDSKARRIWTEPELALLRELYADTPTKGLADKLRRTTRQVYSKATALGIKKSAAYLAGPHACRLRRGDNVGSRTQFKPGLTPWNKGQSHPSTGRAPETQFKRGQSPHNTQPVGSYRLDKDGTQPSAGVFNGSTICWFQQS